MRPQLRTIDYNESSPIERDEPLVASRVIMALVPPASHVDPLLAAPAPARRMVAAATLWVFFSLLLLSAVVAFVLGRGLVR
jgi:hypothetical protein